MRNELIVIITETDTRYDAEGFEIATESVKNEVFAEIKTTTYREFFEAQKVGEKAEDIFVISEDDYKACIIKAGSNRFKPNLVEYDDTLYRIVRRYRRATNADYIVELTCVEVE